ncbi:MAG: PHB depolymerase family esterase [Gemmatimonadaceae bacterium]|nr:PHB depolymerase family esterase [Gemmatimonadaceae bacterium]
MDLILLAALTVAPLSPGGSVGGGRPQASDLSPSADTSSADGGSFAWGTYDGPEGSRRYKLYVPTRRDGTKGTRLIVMLHGCTQDPDDIARGTRMNELARRDGFLVLYPEQPASAQPLKCWTWYDKSHQQRGKGEPGIIAGMTQRVMRENEVDPNRVYLAGLSAGAAMGAILGATYPDIYRALALHSGIAYGLATDVSQALGAMRTPGGAADALGSTVTTAMGDRKRVMSVLIVQGTVDASVNQANGPLLAAQWASANGLGTAKAEAVKEGKPNKEPKTKQKRNEEKTGLSAKVGGPPAYSVVRSVYSAANGPPMVDLWMIQGLGHAWSGGSKEGTFTDERGPDVSSAIVSFFKSTENSGR